MVDYNYMEWIFCRVYIMFTEQGESGDRCHMGIIPPNPPPPPPEIIPYSKLSREGIPYGKPSSGINLMAEPPQGGTIPYGKASPSMVNLPPHKSHDKGTNTMVDCPHGNNTI